MNDHWFRNLLRRRLIVVFLLLAQIALLIYTLLSRSLTSTLISGFLSFLSIGVCLHIISNRDKGAFKLTWVFQIMLFPLFGGMFYLFFKLQSSTRRYRRIAIRSAAKILGLIDLPGHACTEACRTAPERAPQIHYLQNHAGFPIFTGSQTRYLPSGEAMHESLLEDLRKAEHYIFLEYFIVQEGRMWNTILDILKEKAREGVVVRLLYDDMGCFLKLPEDYPKRLREYGIDCIVFNPFRPVLSTLQNNRDHRKIAVIDGTVAYTGGINLADEYINAVEKHGHWKDVAIRLEGKAAWSFTLMFLQMWEQCSGVDEDYTAYYPWHHSPCPTPSDGFVQPYADSPMDRENVGEHVYLQMIGRAKDYVYINTPYLIIDDSMVSALCLAAKSGVDVRILTPHRWDKRIVHFTTRSYYRELLQSGVKIYEYTIGFNHAKTFVSDDAVATVGTTNLDFRSLYHHFECGTVLYGSRAVMEVKEDFLNTLPICHGITQQELRSNVFVRMAQDALRLFAPLM